MKQQNFNFSENKEVNVQKLACDIDSSVFLFANAGTGKTKTLCDRFIAHVLFGTDAYKILCLTYTNAAAEEMKERILSLAFEWSNLEELDLKEEISKRYQCEINNKLLHRAKNLYEHLISSFSDLKIQTLHAFCSSLLSRFREYNPQEIKFDIANTIQMKKIRAAAIDKALASSDYLQQIDISKYYSLGEIREKLEGLVSKSANLKRFFDKYDVAKLDEVYAGQFGNGILRNPKEIEEEILANESSYIDYIKSHHPKIYKAVNLIGKSAWGRLEIYFTKEGEVRKNLIKLNDDKINDEIFRIERLLIELKKSVSKQINVFFIKLAHIVLGEIEAQKDKKQILEFDDLLIQTHKLLSSDENAQNILYKLDYEIDQILVDEAQDLSSHQWEIINLLSSEFFSGVGAREVCRNIFVVGDFKQSIYSFQGAEPSVFLKMSDYYQSKCADINRPFQKLEMIKSYRTTKTILNLVDQIFEGDDLLNSKHLYARKGDGMACVYPLIPKNKDSTDGWILPKKDDEDLGASIILAKKIAFELKSWIDSRRYIAGKNRPIEPKDIFILFRKRSELMLLVSKELRKVGINVNSQIKINLAESLLFGDFKSLLQFVINPHDDLNLAGLLKSPFFNLSDKDLVNCFNTDPISLYERIKIKDEVLGENLQFYLNLYSNKSVVEFFEVVIKKNFENFLIRFGQIAECLIEVLLFNINSLAKDGIGYLELLAEFDNFEIEVDPKNNSEDAVSLMTIHSSKGLQAPVIVIADSSSSANIPIDDIIWINEVPIIISPKKFNDQFIDKIKEINKRKQREESDRLLYVALTRAEDELYALGVENKSQDKSWYSKIELFAAKQDYKEESILSKNLISEYYNLFVNKLVSEEMEFKFISNLSFSSKETIKGELSHHFLELISNGVAIEDISRYALEYSDKLTDLEIEACVNKIHRVCKKYPWLFGDNTDSEVSFQKSNGQEFRVDKLIFKEDEVLIVDFKSDENVPRSIAQVRSDYIKQLREYSEVIQRVYNKKVNSAIIWLEDASIIEI